MFVLTKGQISVIKDSLLYIIVIVIIIIIICIVLIRQIVESTLMYIVFRYQLN